MKPPTSSHGLVAAVFALGLLLLPAGAGAVSIGLDPAAQSVQPGDAVSVDVVFSDLGGEIISTYDLDVIFDPGVLVATDVLFTTQLGDPDALFFPEVFSDFDLSTSGLVDLSQLSLLDDDMLFALQGGETVTVATIAFQALGAGTTDLEFVFDAVNDVKGRDAAVLPIDPSGASVTVEGPSSQSPVPEPSAGLLFAVGSLLVAPALRGSRHRA